MTSEPDTRHRAEGDARIQCTARGARTVTQQDTDVCSKRRFDALIGIVTSLPGGLFAFDEFDTQSSRPCPRATGPATDSHESGYCVSFEKKLLKLSLLPRALFFRNIRSY